MEYEQDKITEKDSAVAVVWIIVGIWFLLGFIAFILSLTCFGKTGTLGEKFVGLLIALITGPFYFIYYAVMKDYCNNPLLSPVLSKKK